MKKILITLLALTLALVMLFALTACGGDDADSDANTADGGDNSGGAAVHQHSVASMKMENTVPATCSQNGSYDEVSYCSCGDVISRNTVTVDKIPHSTVSHEAKSVTCTE
ncbi:MAG: hypothetical protein J6Q69_00100, partial [Clostridia bacterium]|nr:hypothetical protein [Clostridia bacterium]